MITHALKTVFSNQKYTLLAGVVAFVVFAFGVWFPNIRVLASILANPTISISDKLTFPIHLLQSITTNFTTLSASYTIATALLLGINVAMVLYYVRNRVAEVKQSGIAMGFLGIASGVLGIGCAACGSLLLTSILSSLGASVILTQLPLRGGEFGILGVILLSVSLYLTARQIQNPLVCKIK